MIQQGYISEMDPILTAFSGEPPSLVLPAGSIHRDGLLDERAARRAAADAGGRLAPASLSVLQGLLFLWHDHWGPAHEIAQSSEGEPDHDLLHAVLHRREGDFANAGYWFRRAGKHACYPILERNLASPHRERAGIPADPPGMEGGRWSPSAFLASVKKRAQSGQAETSEGSIALRRIQAEEIRAFALHLLSA